MASCEFLSLPLSCRLPSGFSFQYHRIFDPSGVCEDSHLWFPTIFSACGFRAPVLVIYLDYLARVFRAVVYALLLYYSFRGMTRGAL